MKLVRIQVKGSIGLPVFLMARPGERQSTDLKIPIELQSLVTELLNAKRVANVHDTTTDILSATQSRLPGFTQLTPTKYRYQGYYLKATLLENSLTECQALNSLEELDIKALPKFVGLVPINENEALTIVHYPGSIDRHHRPYNDATSQLSLTTKRRFVDDMATLLEQDLWHPHSIQGTRSLFVDTKGNIIIEPWEALKTIDGQDKDQILSRIENILGLNYETVLRTTTPASHTPTT